MVLTLPLSSAPHAVPTSLCRLAISRPLRRLHPWWIVLLLQSNQATELSMVAVTRPLQPAMGGAINWEPGLARLPRVWVLPHAR